MGNTVEGGLGRAGARVYSVRLVPFERTFPCEEGETVLEAGLRAGYNLRYGCKHGGCGACKAKIIKGDVDIDVASSFALTDRERENGYALLCVTRPLTDLEIVLNDLSAEELLSAPAVHAVQEIVTELESVSIVARNIVAFRLRFMDCLNFAFRPGQYIDLRVPGTDQWRSYSMANTPQDRRGLDFLLKPVPGGVWSSYLTERAKLGDIIRIRGPFGSFHLRKDGSQLIFVAGGSGLAPVWAMLQQMRDECDSRPAWLYFGARSAADLVYVDKLKRLEHELANFRFIPAVSEPHSSPGWEGETGLITEVLERVHSNWIGADGYLCGPPAMVDAAVEVLIRHGVPRSRIYFDKFV